MNGMDLLRLVDTISRDKNIEKELIYEDIETAMVSAARKAYDIDDEVAVRIDRLTGDIVASVNGAAIEMTKLGRIAAQTAKQVMIQRIREAERSSIFDEYSERVGTVVTGTVSRFEGGALLVNLGRTDGYIPRSEQIPGETHHPGERIRGMILDVHESTHQVKIVLTRTHPDYIRRLFELEVPEVADRIIEIRALAREAGYRTKVAVASIDMKVDAVGACVGVRGSRIRNIVDELGGEKIDIVRWNESSQILIGNALKPAEIQEVALCFELGRATVVVAEDQLSLAIGKRGQNVRLAARLTGWDIDISTPAEYNKGLDDMMSTLREIEGVEDVLLDKLLAMGIISLMDVKGVGAEPLIKELSLGEEVAAAIVQAAVEGVERLAAEAAAAKAAAAEAAKLAAEEAAKAETESDIEAEGSETSTDEVEKDGEELSGGDSAVDDANEPAGETSGDDEQAVVVAEAAARVGESDEALEEGTTQAEERSSENSAASPLPDAVADANEPPAESAADAEGSIESV